MDSTTITYRKTKKYKYQLTTDYPIEIDIKKEAVNNFIQLKENGSLLIKEKYAWDGPSGPTFDSKSFMRASLVHDALYQLIREGKLNSTTDRKTADKILKKLCIEDKMWRIRAYYSYLAVRWFGYFAAKPDKKKNTIYFAP